MIIDNYLFLKGRGLNKRKVFSGLSLKEEASRRELFNYLITNYSVRKKQEGRNLKKRKNFTYMLVDISPTFTQTIPTTLISKGCISILNKAKNLPLLANREQGIGMEIIGNRKKVF
ncbi:MAG: hypothetical protein AB4080_17185 [Trichodesmium sp.]